MFGKKADKQQDFNKIEDIDKIRWRLRSFLEREYPYSPAMWCEENMLLLAQLLNQPEPVKKSAIKKALERGDIWKAEKKKYRKQLKLRGFTDIPRFF